ncbi:MAG: nucleoside kinase [Bacilli bacterium]|nr:nucleoside kinase [Bacilli bacterium]
MIENVKLKIMGEVRTVAKGVTLLDIAKDYQEQFKYPIILAKAGNRYRELTDQIISNDDITFVDLKERRGNLVYVNALIFLMSYSACVLFGKDARVIVKYSIDKGIYIETNFELDEKKCASLKEKMMEIAEKDIAITKCRVNRSEAIEYFEAKKDISKVELLKYSVNSYITLYKMGGMYDYFFSMMPPSTGDLKYFDLHFLNNRGFVLLFPTIYIDGIKEYEHHPKLFDVFKEYQKWADIMKIGNVPALNKIVTSGRADDIIRIDEMLQSNRLLNIARDIVTKKEKVRIILIAGPSSSGKTTSCRKLSMYLRSFGLEPKEISMDDYFIDKDKTPKDENGEYDFECLEALDVKRFDSDVKKLLEGHKVKLPRYNFLKGRSEEGTEETSLGENEVLIIEGIHALNEQILTSIDRNKKFKIYLSPLTILNIDIHNRISSTDNRLLRRIVRDNRTRGHKVEDTLKIWRKVRLGEEKHIFPNQDAADATFNTALIYELGILKTYVEPLLYSVQTDSPYYEEARRLINMLKNFLPIPSEAVPDDSLLREFIGGSCFK